MTAEMQEEPYFVDFLREAPEPTGNFLNNIKSLTILLY